MKAKSVGGAQTPNAPEPRVESPYIDQTAKGGIERAASSVRDHHQCLPPYWCQPHPLL